MASMGNFTIKFDEEQLKRFEAAAARFPEGTLGDSPDKQSHGTPVTHGIRTRSPSPYQAMGLNRLLGGLVKHGAILKRGKRVQDLADAIQWLRERG